MAQIFHSSANTLIRVAIVGGALLAGGAVSISFLIFQSPYQTGQRVVKSQPVPFSHEHHVRGLGVDCRYCHTSVEESPYAGMPPTHTCMSCHSQIWTDSPMLAPVRESYAEDKPIAWNRIHDLPDYAYFNHSVHVKKGVGCYSCHGRIDQMPIAWKAEPMSMGWCLKCHRNPEEHLRPRDQIYNLAWSVEEDQDEVKDFVRQEFGSPEYDRIAADDDHISQEELGRLLASKYEVPTLGHDTPLTNCAVCHR